MASSRTMNQELVTERVHRGTVLAKSQPNIYIFAVAGFPVDILLVYALHRFDPLLRFHLSAGSRYRKFGAGSGDSRSGVMWRLIYTIKLLQLGHDRVDDDDDGDEGHLTLASLAHSFLDDDDITSCLESPESAGPLV